MSILFDELAKLRDQIEKKIVECHNIYSQNRKLLDEFNIKPGSVSLGQCNILF